MGLLNYWPLSLKIIFSEKRKHVLSFELFDFGSREVWWAICEAQKLGHCCSKFINTRAGRLGCTRAIEAQTVKIVADQI